MLVREKKRAGESEITRTNKSLAWLWVEQQGAAPTTNAISLSEAATLVARRQLYRSFTVALLLLLLALPSMVIETMAGPWSPSVGMMDSNRARF